MKIEEKLKKEAEKQYQKARQLRKNIKFINERGEEMIRNIDAYLADYKYFLTEGKIIEAFEAVVWAWAWIEIGLFLNILKIKNKE